MATLRKGRNGLIVEGTRYDKLVVPDRFSSDIPEECDVLVLRVVHDTKSEMSYKGVLFVRIEHDPNCHVCALAKARALYHRLIAKWGHLPGVLPPVEYSINLRTMEALARVSDAGIDLHEVTKVEYPSEPLRLNFISKEVLEQEKIHLEEVNSARKALESFEHLPALLPMLGAPEYRQHQRP